MIKKLMALFTSALLLLTPCKVAWTMDVEQNDNPYHRLEPFTPMSEFIGEGIGRYPRAVLIPAAAAFEIFEKLIKFSGQKNYYDIALFSTKAIALGLCPIFAALDAVRLMTEHMAFNGGIEGEMINGLTLEQLVEINNNINAHLGFEQTIPLPLNEININKNTNIQMEAMFSLATNFSILIAQNISDASAYSVLIGEHIKSLLPDSFVNFTYIYIAVVLAAFMLEQYYQSENGLSTVKPFAEMYAKYYGDGASEGTANAEKNQRFKLFLDKLNMLFKMPAIILGSTGMAFFGVANKLNALNFKVGGNFESPPSHYTNVTSQRFSEQFNRSIDEDPFYGMLEAITFGINDLNLHGSAHFNGSGVLKLDGSRDIAQMQALFWMMTAVFSFGVLVHLTHVIAR